MFNSVKLCYCACLKHLMILIKRQMANSKTGTRIVGQQAESVKTQNEKHKEQREQGAKVIRVQSPSYTSSQEEGSIKRKVYRNRERQNSRCKRQLGNLRKAGRKQAELRLGIHN